KEQAEQACRVKNQFLAMLSHELRTPLTPVLLAAGEMLDDPSTPPSHRDSLEMIRQNVELEARLIGDLLDVMGVLRGKLLARAEPVSGHTLLDRAVEICVAEFVARGVTLHVEREASSDSLLGDAARLLQVLWNLLKNAVKFTPEGGTVRVRTGNEGGRF